MFTYVLNTLLKIDDVGFENWSNWGSCTAECNGGIENRTRECKAGMNPDLCFGHKIEERVCNAEQCKGKHIILFKYVHTVKIMVTYLSRAKHMARLLKLHFVLNPFQLGFFPT